ncbi:MAG: hypothetical protein VX724_04755 [Chloroflexota bacterium]|nr:hypothetical protein [Chloroflexota bacterium]
MTLRTYLSNKYFSKTNVRFTLAAGIVSALSIWTVAGLMDFGGTSSGNLDPLSPIVTETSVSGDYEPLSEEVISTMLSMDDVLRITGDNFLLTVEFRDGKAMAAGVDPSQVIAIESWITATFRSMDPIRGMIFSVMDFDSPLTAQDHFNNVILETPGLIVMADPVGDISANVVFNGAGLGSIVMYRHGDLFLSLHTVQPSDVEPMLPLGGLVELARLVEDRIS